MNRTLQIYKTFLLGLFIGLAYALLVSGPPDAVLPEWFQYRVFILTFSGVVGGILYTVMLDGKIEMPYMSEDGRDLQIGILGDILLGISGAYLLDFVTDYPSDTSLSNFNILLAAKGIVGGYGAKALLNMALEKVLKRIHRMETVTQEAVQKKQELSHQVEELSDQNQSLTESGELIDQVNLQVNEGLPSRQLADLKQRIRSASPDVRQRIFGLVKEMRSMSWRSQGLRNRTTRTIPIFEALVASDERYHPYHAQLAFACKDAVPPELDRAIVELDRAIELRGEQEQAATWKYELNRAIARIEKEYSETGGVTSDPSLREAILKDLLAVTRTHGLAQVINQAEAEQIPTPIMEWIVRNQDWLRSHPDTRNLINDVLRTVPGRNAIAAAPSGQVSPQRDAGNGPSVQSGPPTSGSTMSPPPSPPSDGGVAVQPKTANRWALALAQAPTNGASDRTASQDGLSGGLTASHKMAERDLPEVKRLAERFRQVGDRAGIPPALIAAIASRESRCGRVLDANGRGDHGNAFGIMQVDQRYHTQAGSDGDPASLEHLSQGVGILADGLRQVEANHSDWEDPYILRGAIAAYNFGVSNVRTKAGIDEGTTGDDYSSDVVARAQFFIPHLLLTPVTVSDQNNGQAVWSVERIAETLQTVEDAIPIDEWDEAMATAIKQGLARLYLWTPGADLKQAWAVFKQSIYQSDPDYIGPGSVRLLLDALGVDHPAAEESVPAEDTPTQTNPDAGSQTGTSKHLPHYNQLVYENEYIIAGVPLTWGECTKGMSRWPTQKLEVDNGRRLAKVFGEVRAAFGEPLIITSGFRPEPINRRVGGVSNSQHVPFKALDIRPLRSANNEGFARLLQILRNNPKVVGIGRGQRKGFLHMDIRDGRRVEWDY
ncbi:uncharacterized protein XM38_036800 [Halomicronema hongdechloris C2206]|uniref:Peptidase M15A C-terminal domain-containing protein n=1 Tax=Halomicronema hongdechloris C2206 TaxID=1641165 RepID=A0A1Z3HR41_9CYAN|nr:D-Ala-D-Ala carboxypeptidase family metallohydrolase [Halomicronema hongdechloris]ASC72722.1 uncharacterized protein XM38_036800 [Halomicronema hongdechloris C2206]